MKECDLVALMESSSSSDEWNDNLRKVQVEFGGKYPEFWYAAIVASGVATKTFAKFGASTDIKVTALAEKPIPNLYGRPNTMPYLEEGEQVVGIWNQGLGDKRTVCNSLMDMQKLYDSYASGMALTLKWVIASSPTMAIPVS